MLEGGQRITQFANGNGSQGLEKKLGFRKRLEA
jgi:hypothetical protein